MLFLLIISYIISLFQVKNIEKKNLIYGINGHPLTQEAYLNNISLQVKLIKSLGCKFYRVDIPTDSIGNIINNNDFKSKYSFFKKNNITILPVIVFSQNIYKVSNPKINYLQGLVFGRNFAKKNKNSFTYYEVGNEEDNNIIIPNTHGTSQTEYDSTKAKLIMAYFKGVCEGIKKEDPLAKLIINHAWVHWGFLELLNVYGVKFDIIGCHWYSDMGDLNMANSNFGNVPNTLHKKFGKQIWVTEFNIKNGTTKTLKKTDQEWLNRNLNFIQTNKHIRAVFLYELLDQPAFSDKKSAFYNEGEVNYGLAVWSKRYKEISSKSIYNIYKSFIYHTNDISKKSKYFKN